MRGMKTTSLYLTKEDAQEVLHKLSILADSCDLQQDYGLTQEQANELQLAVPAQGGDFLIPDWAATAVREEMRDHCEVMRSLAYGARQDRKNGQALLIGKQIKRFERLFNL